MEQALADLEIMLSAFPDETTTSTPVTFPVAADGDEKNAVSFPLHVTLRLSETAHCILEYVEGYPTASNIQISSYRSSPNEKARMEATVAAIRATAQECLEDGVEGGLACCAVALETWNDVEEAGGEHQDDGVTEASSSSHPRPITEKKFDWISGEPLMDRKSTFQAHVCRITSENDVKLALQELMDSSPKLHRATHNMLAWRLRERMQPQQAFLSDDGTTTTTTVETTATNTILKHDNDDDGEDAAGSRLAHLLEMRDENGVLVVVSRWFGGVHLGPKRFAHITNVARQLLTDWHVQQQQQQQQQSRKK